MTHQNNGGPAYPTPFENEHGVRFTEYGMSLRDYFAGQALAGLGERMCEDASSAEELLNRPKTLAGWAYTYADAMIAAREAK